VLWRWGTFCILEAFCILKSEKILTAKVAETSQRTRRKAALSLPVSANFASP